VQPQTVTPPRGPPTGATRTPASDRQTITDYGSDRNGLVWAYRFQAGEPARVTTAEDAAQYLGPAGDGCADGVFYWLHFSLANAGAERWLRQFIDIPSVFYEALHAESNPTRVEHDGNALVAVIHDVLFEFHTHDIDVSTVWLVVRPGAVVSARVKPVRSIDRLRESVRAGAPCRSPVALLAHLFENQATVLIDVVRSTNDAVDEIEDKMFANRLGGHRAKLSSLRRMLVRLQRLLAPEPAALFRLVNRPPAWISEEDLIDLRRSAEEFAAAAAECTALVERAKLIQEELAAMLNEQTNRSLFVLTFVTVLCLPFNVTGALFGMNVGGIPFASDPAGFWVIFVLITVATVALARSLWQRFRR